MNGITALDITIKNINHHDAMPEGLSFSTSKAYGKRRIIAYRNGEQWREIGKPGTSGQVLAQLEAIEEALDAIASA